MLRKRSKGWAGLLLSSSVLLPRHCKYQKYHRSFTIFAVVVRVFLFVTSFPLLPQVPVNSIRPQSIKIVITRSTVVLIHRCREVIHLALPTYLYLFYKYSYQQIQERIHHSNSFQENQISPAPQPSTPPPLSPPHHHYGLLPRPTTTA